MSPIHLYDGKILIRDGKLATDSKCCCGCPECEGPTCCNGEYPRAIGICCEGVWRMPNEGVCCSGTWYPNTTDGICCSGVWYTEPGDCCGDVWYPAPPGKSSPDRNAYPFVPVWWETDQCPSGMIYARYGEGGSCCGCIPDTVYHPVKTTCSPYSRDNADCYVPTSTVLVPDPDLGNQYPICCDPCATGIYLKYNYEYDEYGAVIGCNGICCTYDGDCSNIPESLCNSTSHPTKPGLFISPPSQAYIWRPTGSPCCPSGCLTECCENGALLYKSTYEVTGEALVNSQWEWSFPPPGPTISRGFTYDWPGDFSLEVIADSLTWNTPGALYSNNSTTITMISPVAHLGTLTYFPPSLTPPPLTLNTTCFGYGATATITSTDSNTGAILDIEVTNGGSGYAILNRTAPTITIGGGSGNGAVLTPVVTSYEDSCGVKHWTIESISVVSGGSGYTYGDLLSATVAAGDTIINQAVIAIYPNAGVIENVVVFYGGDYYREDPSLPPYVSNVTVNIVPSNGSGAILSAVIDDNVSSSTFGQITDITIQDGGSEYTSGEAVVSGPTSTTTQITLHECSPLYNPNRTPRTNGKCPCALGVRCCETVNSSGSGLRFNRPVSLSGTVRVTVTGTTTSPILIHGTLFGANATPEKRCPFTHTFLLCSGSFNIEPTPCNTNFHNLSVEVCYEQATVTAESFNFSGCNNLILVLSNCPYNCITTMAYSGPGHTSNSTIVPGGNFVIEANGTGPLVLTSNITIPQINCINKITLAGTSTAENSLSGQILRTGGDPLNGGQPGPLVTLEKDGPGTWLFVTYHSAVRRLSVLNGTAIIDNVSSLGRDSLAYVGGPYSSGEARFLIRLEPESFQGFFQGDIFVTEGSGQRVILGAVPGTPVEGYGYYGRLVFNRDVTLCAPTDHSVVFQMQWTTSPEWPPEWPSPPATDNVRIGHPDFRGTVILNGEIDIENGNGGYITSGIVSVEYGKALLQYLGPTLSAGLIQIHGGAELVLDRIDPEFPASFISSPLGFIGNNGIISGPGTVNLVSLNIAGNNHIISSLVAINTDSTITGNGNLLISGIISGSSNLTQSSSGTITLSGDNTYTGTTTINSGIMKAESLTAFGTGDIIVNVGGTLNKNGFAITNNIINNGGMVID